MKIIINSESTPEQLVAFLCRGSKLKPTGIFWEAMDALKKCNEARARSLFEAEYITPPDTEDSARASQIFALANGIPPYTRDFDWVDLFAAAGLTDAVSQLVEATRVHPLHALHAEVELAPRFFPNPTLVITAREAHCLLLAYELEAEVLMQSRLGSYHVEKWLNERSKRAVEYLAMLNIESPNGSFHIVKTAS